MSLDIDRGDPIQAKVRFILDSDNPVGRVSVVGSFNDWTPGLDELSDDGDGTRSVTVGLPYGRQFIFRYLGPGDRWFDDPDADRVSSAGSIIEALRPLP
ncbi:isoamylase early set domain-containing protein [Jatrophihabitans telluris]|uniref:Isoamylase early set domain-containing protein n=1 Tax=Jatrophihabitans telluris TaxID=2038343 RepID=A0ABY4QVT4_9ACTN|nr:isoamylase early set domain-containing protein [Jatrophihabitans telluris]UQX87389.1 isoamylase early set domain-containing protein [Jatrophihabitans telluris]